MSSLLERFLFDMGSGSLWMWEYDAIEGDRGPPRAFGRFCCGCGAGDFGTGDSLTLAPGKTVKPPPSLASVFGLSSCGVSVGVHSIIPRAEGA